MDAFAQGVQRRWSETAAAEMSGAESSEQAVRRWSMPWDCRHVTEWPRQDTTTARSRLRVPGPYHQEQRSRSSTPESLWKAQQSATQSASQDGLREAIQLLSCKPGLRPSSHHHHHHQPNSAHQAASAYHQPVLPGVTLTACSYETIGYESSASSSSVWPGSCRAGAGGGSSRGTCWPHDYSHSSDYSDHSGHRDSDHSVHSCEHRDSEHSVGSGSGHGDSKDSIHSHSDYGGHRESDPGPVELLQSRKNSSSTDSCISAHSRSGSESAAGAGESVRSNLYSMWSGSDLPFIKLTESSENQEDSTR
ncbi:uncharacterized protein LOC106635935 [Copidosoma floridanum]|uniref:uncharacterized protein LOC106635935 n=1 Tax=Copidosoma floridanum TaxID=29053 RepID=UPI0006C96104|nr:uncharacterized protein LOC106635935 [Copidosoma floridanum]